MAVKSFPAIQTSFRLPNLHSIRLEHAPKNANGLLEIHVNVITGFMEGAYWRFKYSEVRDSL